MLTMALHNADCHQSNSLDQLPLLSAFPVLVYARGFTSNSKIYLSSRAELQILGLNFLEPHLQSNTQNIGLLCWLAILYFEVKDSQDGQPYCTHEAHSR